MANHVLVQFVLGIEAATLKNYLMLSTNYKRALQFTTNMALKHF